MLIQNLAPGAAERAGFGSAAMRAKNKRLITVDISGYGDHGPYKDRRAYDLLVQAESGTGLDHRHRARAGPHRHLGDRHRHRHVCARRRSRGADRPRQKTGEGRAISVSLFSSMAEWMSVPLLAKDYRHYDWPRLGLTHPTIAPYGVYPTQRQGAGADLDPERPRVRAALRGRARQAGPGEGPALRHQQGAQRAARRHQCHRAGKLRWQSFDDPGLRGSTPRRSPGRGSARSPTCPSIRSSGACTSARPRARSRVPALAASYAGQPERLGDVPELGQHTDQVRREFAA